MWRKRRRSDSVLWQKTPIPTENSKRNAHNKNATINFDYTTIADQLRTVSWSNNSHPTGVVKPVYGYPSFPLATKVVYKRTHILTFINNPPYILVDWGPTANESGEVRCDARPFSGIFKTSSIQSERSHYYYVGHYYMKWCHGCPTWH